MTLIELRNEVIRRGVISVEKELKGPKLVGSLRGFAIAKTLTLPLDFERQLSCRYRKECKLRETPGETDLDLFWAHRYATIQIEHVFEVLKIAWKFPMISGRAMLLYADIVGVRRS